MGSSPSSLRVEHSRATKPFSFSFFTFNIVLLIAFPISTPWSQSCLHDILTQSITCVPRSLSFWSILNSMVNLLNYTLPASSTHISP